MRKVTLLFIALALLAIVLTSLSTLTQESNEIDKEQDIEIINVASSVSQTMSKNTQAQADALTIFRDDVSHVIMSDKHTLKHYKQGINSILDLYEAHYGNGFDDLHDTIKVKFFEDAGELWMGDIFDKIKPFKGINMMKFEKKAHDKRPAMVNVYFYMTEYNKIHRTATALMEQYKHYIPASFTIAQGGLETGWGKSKGGGTHGNKWREIDGENGFDYTVTVTKEHYTKKQFKQYRSRIIAHKKMPNGMYEATIKDKFIKFKSEWEGYRYRSLKFRRQSRYKDYVNFKDDVFAMVKFIHKKGYATDVDYTRKLSSIIRKYNLEKLDLIVNIINSRNKH